MAIDVTTEQTAQGARARARVAPPSPREADRDAMRRLLSDHGFEHAVGSLATAVAVELVDGFGRDTDQRLEAAAARAETVVLDALVYFARTQGWKGAR